MFKKVCVTFLMGSVFLTGYAEPLVPMTCHSEVLTSYCGTGDVTIKISDHSKYELDYGDIACWDTNFLKKGYVVQKTPSSPVYDLFDLKGDEIIGSLEMDFSKKMGKFVLKEGVVTSAKGSEYHLKCKDDVIPDNIYTFNGVGFDYQCHSSSGGRTEAISDAMSKANTFCQKTKSRSAKMIGEPFGVQVGKVCGGWNPREVSLSIHVTCED